VGAGSTKMEGVYTVDTVDPSCTKISTRINLISFGARLLTRPTRRTASSGKLVTLVWDIWHPYHIVGNGAIRCCEMCG
jgi:hypothetical protein